MEPWGGSWPEPLLRAPKPVLGPSTLGCVDPLGWEQELKPPAGCRNTLPAHRDTARLPAALLLEEMSPLLPAFCCELLFRAKASLPPKWGISGSQSPLLRGKTPRY